MQSGTYIVLGAVLATMAVGLGAMGAHALKDKLDAKQMETFQTAVHYQMVHSMGLVLVGILATQRPARAFDLAAILMFAGIVLFSGFLYAYVATQYKPFAMVVPFGGISFLFAWLAVAVGAIGWNRPM